MAFRLQSKKRSVRRVLCWTVGGFLLLQVLVDVLADCWRPEVRSAHLSRVLSEMRSCSPALEVVFLGTSRVGWGIDARAVQRLLREATGSRSVEVFNASIPSQDYVCEDYLMEKMLEQGLRPALVVIEITPELVARRNRVVGAHVLPCRTWATLSAAAVDLWRALPRGRAELIRQHLVPMYWYRRALLELAVCTSGDQTGHAGAVPSTHCQR